MSALTAFSVMVLFPHQSLAQQQKHGELSYTELFSASDAVMRFRAIKKNVNMRCMNIEIGSSDDGITVDISPADNVRVSGDDITLNSSKCPPGGTFVYSPRGKFLRQALAR